VHVLHYSNHKRPSEKQIYQSGDTLSLSVYMSHNSLHLHTLTNPPLTKVVREFKSLVGTGVREVSFIAQDLGDFGKDADQSPIDTNGELSQATEESLSHQSETPQLISLLNEVSSIGKEHQAWIRLLYLYPDEISQNLLNLMCDGRVLPYLDMPMQVGRACASSCDCE